VTEVCTWTDDRAARMLAELGLGEVREVIPLNGGIAGGTRRVITDLTSVVVKSRPDPPDDYYACEADGLRTLGAAGVRVPDVLEVRSDVIVLEDLGSGADQGQQWKAMGVGLTKLHETRGDRFGFGTDGYLGLFPQPNGWSDDGHDFVARNRILHWLAAPWCERLLTAEDRKRIERLCGRLPDLIPASPPVLLHGDLNSGNMMLDRDGTFALIDPAVAYGWAELDLAVANCYFYDVPREFFDSYREIMPLEDGWEDRLQLLGIIEFLGAVAHVGDAFDIVTSIRRILDRFA
jgi:fructosamine-3-kinase